VTNARVARRARSAASDEAAETFPALIAQAAALLARDVMEQLRAQQTQPVCLVCAARAWRAAKAWEVAVKNARDAAEPPPEKPDMTTAQSFTTGARGPVCWPCFDPDKDGPFDMADYLPPAVD
jgi:hypothetical protein